MKKLLLTILFCFVTSFAYAEYISSDKNYCIRDSLTKLCLDVSGTVTGPGVYSDVTLVSTTYSEEGDIVRMEWTPFGTVEQRDEESWINFSELPGWKGFIIDDELIMLQNAFQFVTETPGTR